MRYASRYLWSAGAAAAVALLAAALPAPSAAAKWTLVVCAPGYPGTTVEARATMDAFAAAVAGAAGFKSGDLSAVYHETLADGVERLRRDDAALAMVTLPFYLQESQHLRLAPRARVLVEPGGAETWSLVAKKGLVDGPPALDGWEILSIAGQFPAFVKGPILGAWGTLPASARINYAPAALSALRRAAAGEHAAVVLDAAGAAALPGLPFAADLEVVTRSAPLPASLVCTVGDRMPKGDAERLVKGLLKLHASPANAGLLKTMRTQRFEPVDEAALQKVQKSYDGAATLSRPPA